MNFAQQITPRVGSLDGTGAGDRTYLTDSAPDREPQCRTRSRHDSTPDF